MLQPLETTRRKKQLAFQGVTLSLRKQRKSITIELVKKSILAPQTITEKIYYRRKLR